MDHPLRALIAAIFWLEIMARISAPRDEPYLVSLTAAEPMTPLDEAISLTMFGEADGG